MENLHVLEGKSLHKCTVPFQKEVKDIDNY